MSGLLPRLNAIYNSTVVTNDEISSLKLALKKGLAEVVESNKELDPEYTSQKYGTGEWRKVEAYDESAQRPLAQSDLEKSLKKLDVL
jgi:hypothetical protein